MLNRRPPTNIVFISFGTFLDKLPFVREFGRFIMVGGINTGGGYLLYLGVLWAGASPVLAYNISYFIGIGVAYLLHLKITFRQSHSGKKMLLFPLVYVVQYTVGLFSLKGFLGLGISPEIAGLLIIPLTVPVTFLMTRWLLR